MFKQSKQKFINNLLVAANFESSLTDTYLGIIIIIQP